MYLSIHIRFLHNYQGKCQQFGKSKKKKKPSKKTIFIINVLWFSFLKKKIIHK